MHNAYTVHWVYNALFTTWCLFIFLFPGATFPFFFSSLSEKPQFEKFSHLWVPLCVEAVDVWLWVLRSVEVKYINQSNPPSLLLSCIDVRAWPCERTDEESTLKRQSHNVCVWIFVLFQIHPAQWLIWLANICNFTEIFEKIIKWATPLWLKRGVT